MMEELTNVLNNADDDYLIGLSNKGIVKRAYKDLEQIEPSVNYKEHAAEVSISEETCTIVSPLGDSKCTCQSRSICRHIIAAILWLKKTNGESQEKKELSQEFVDALSSFPLQKIQKAMKKRYYLSFIQNMEHGVVPEIEETSIISVNMPNEEMNVRLVFPLTHSTCTCHSKELCKHKAAAILAWQVKQKIQNLDNIKINEEITTHLNVSLIHSTADIVRKFLTDILSNGLVRVSDMVSEHARDIGIMCHNANLANSEKLMREMGNRLEEYVKHSSEFRANLLFSLIMENIILVDRILKTNEEKELYVYAGEFKNNYTAGSTLELIPIAQRKFSSIAGYEGEVYYFLNKNQKEQKSAGESTFLSYTDVRPTFYEGGRGSVRTRSVPWGFEGNMNEIMNSELRLKNPKLSNGKISSSKNTTVDILGKADLNQDIVRKAIYTDFKKMIEEVFSNTSHSEGERLVMISPKKCISSKSDEITQSHSIIVEDDSSHSITIRARYNSDHKKFFETLQQIGERMQNNAEQSYVIFANAYIEKGICYLYPIAIFNHITVSHVLEEAVCTGSEDKTDINGDVSEWGYFSELFHEIQEALYDIIQCGINSFDFYDRIKEYSIECKKSGLLVLGNELEHLYELLKVKNHTYNNDNGEIVSIISDIYAYLSAGIEKTEVQQAIHHLHITV